MNLSVRLKALEWNKRRETNEYFFSFRKKEDEFDNGDHGVSNHIHMIASMSDIQLNSPILQSEFWCTLLSK